MSTFVRFLLFCRTPFASKNLFDVIEEKIVKRSPLFGPMDRIADRYNPVARKFRRDYWSAESLLLAAARFFCLMRGDSAQEGKVSFISPRAMIYRVTAAAVLAFPAALAWARRVTAHLVVNRIHLKFSPEKSTAARQRILRR
jgi:hypothetical protein